MYNLWSNVFFFVDLKKVKVLQQRTILVGFCLFVFCFEQTINMISEAIHAKSLRKKQPYDYWVLERHNVLVVQHKQSLYSPWKMRAL
jgi:hypothetical protein